MPKPSFSVYRTQGYKPLSFHQIGRAQAAYLVGRNLPSLYAFRFRARQAAAPTIAEAVALVRAQLPAKRIN